MDEQLEAAASQRLEWRASRRYDFHAVDLYDESRGHGTFAGPQPQSRFRIASMADDVAEALNGAYRQGILRGRGELLQHIERVAHSPHMTDPAVVAALLAIVEVNGADIFTD